MPDTIFGKLLAGELSHCPRASSADSMKPADSSSGVVWALPTTKAPASSTTKVSVMVPPASIARTRGRRSLPRTLFRPFLRAGDLEQLLQGLLDQVPDRVDVGHGVVIGEQAEVDLAVVAHDRDRQGVVLGQEGDRHDLLHLAPEQVERELRSWHIGHDQVEE